MARLIRRERAKRDLIEQFAFLAATAGLETAYRFVEAAEHFLDLVQMPQMGSRQTFRGADFMRRWRIRGFENHLVFYRPLRNG